MDVKVRPSVLGDDKMRKRIAFVLFLVVALMATYLPTAPVRAQAKIKIAFVPGVVDPFYQTMQKGIEQAAADLGVEVVTQVPAKFDPTVQTPIINALAADKSIS